MPYTVDKVPCQYIFTRSGSAFEVMFGGSIATGGFSHVYLACQSDQVCNYVAKLVPLHSMRSFRLEYLMAYLVGERGIGPRVHEVRTCMMPSPWNESSAIIMDKWEGSLMGWLQTHHDMDTQWKKMISSVIHSCHVLHMDMNICHTDLYTRNIVYRPVSDHREFEVGLIDFGLAVPWNYRAADGIRKRKSASDKEHAMTLASFDLADLVFGRMYGNAPYVAFNGGIVLHNDPLATQKLRFISLIIQATYGPYMCHKVMVAFDIAVSQIKAEHRPEFARELFDARPHSLMTIRRDKWLAVLLHACDEDVIRYVVGDGNALYKPTLVRFLVESEFGSPGSFLRMQQMVSLLMRNNGKKTALHDYLSKNASLLSHDWVAQDPAVPDTHDNKTSIDELHRFGSPRIQPEEPYSWYLFDVRKKSDDTFCATIDYQDGSPVITFVKSLAAAGEEEDITKFIQQVADQLDVESLDVTVCLQKQHHSYKCIITATSESDDEDEPPDHVKTSFNVLPAYGNALWTFFETEQGKL